MDIESRAHLERLRDRPEVKAALFSLSVGVGASEARFERSARNSRYWEPIDQLVGQIREAGRCAPMRRALMVYGQPCLLLAVPLAPVADSPFAVAIVAADAAALTDADELTAQLQNTCRDYWYGGSFWK